MTIGERRHLLNPLKTCILLPPPIIDRDSVEGEDEAPGEGLRFSPGA